MTISIAYPREWNINNASAEGWHAVHLDSGAVLGPFPTWQEAALAIEGRKKGAIKRRESANADKEGGENGN